MSYKYLVVAALQEELNEFSKLLNPKVKQVGLDVESASFAHNGEDIEVLTFSVGQMGMPFNAAKVMQVISRFNPRFIFFIGTCAGLRDHKLGSVLIPKKVFSYESGKYEDGEFKPDYVSYDTSETLRKKAEKFNGLNGSSLEYEVVTDEDFCSGAAVIDDENLIEKIKSNGSRKLSGLDMEAYSIACLNNILKPKNDLLVIKGISDFAKKKGQSEQTGNKELAKKNCADFTLKLIESFEENQISKYYVDENLRMQFSATFNDNDTYKLKLWVKLENICTSAMVIESISFETVSSVKLDPGAGNELKNFTFFIGKDSNLKDVRDNIILLKPGESVKGCWVPIDPSFSKENLEKALENKNVGTWKYLCNYLGEQPTSREFSRKM